MVAVAENTADELARSDGREVQLEEDPDLQLPFLLPEDGYSCDVVRNIPSGLQEFLDPLCQRGKQASADSFPSRRFLSLVAGLGLWSPVVTWCWDQPSGVIQGSTSVGPRLPEF